MKYSEFFWKHIDTLCSDTSLAHSFGETVWNHQQQEIDALKSKLQHIKSIMEEELDGVDVDEFHTISIWSDSAKSIMEMLK